MVNLEVSKRQAFGVRFNAVSSDAAQVALIHDGSLQLSPHPDWELPNPNEITWKENPFSDNNWLTQFHMLRWMDPLRRQAELGDDQAARTWIAYAKSWCTANLRAENLNKFVWADMVDGIRALELVLGAPLVHASDAESVEWHTEAVQSHVDWLSDEQHLGHGNHALHQHLGLMVAAAFLERSDIVSIAVARLQELFLASYDEQGMNAEGAVGYHHLNYKWWKDAALRLKREGVLVPEIFSRLDLAPRALAHATTPTGTFVSIGDTDGGSPTGVQHAETNWMTSKGTAGEPPPSKYQFYDAGYYFGRSGWGDEERDFSDETHFSARFGPADRIHGHPDGGSITFTSGGVDWLIDPGKFQYGRHPMRSYCLSRESHNNVSILGQKYDRTTMVECQSHVENDRVVDLTFIDPGYADVLLSRRFIYSKNGEYFAVVDSVESARQVTAVQNWQTPSCVDVEKFTHGVNLSADSGPRLTMRYMGTRTDINVRYGETNPLRGWASTGWKKAEASPSIAFSKSGKKFRFITIIAPGYKGRAPEVHPVRTGDSNLLAFQVSTGRLDEQMIITPEFSTTSRTSDEPRRVSEAYSVIGTPPLNYDDEDARSAAFDAIESAYKLAELGRVSSADAVPDDVMNPLQQWQSSTVDLGVRAVLADLGVAVRANVPAGRVQLRRGFKNASLSPTREKAPLIEAGDRLPSPLPNEAIISWRFGSLVLPGYLNSKVSGDTLTVLFHGAVDRAKTSLPLFQRIRFQHELAAGPFIAFADPTLDLSASLRLGWYLGTERVDLPASIAGAVQEVAHALGVSKIVLVGSSGGGFAALQTACFITDSIVVAFDPQTDLHLYYPSPVSEAFGIALGASRDEVARDEALLARTRVLDRIRSNSSSFSLMLVQNSGDAVHLERHADPLRRGLMGISGVDMATRSVNLGPGHHSPGNDIYRSIMNDIYSSLAPRG